MTDLFDYLKWRGDLSFSQDGFHEADGLVLSAISYLPFEYVENPFIKVQKLNSLCKSLLKVPEIEKKVLLKGDVKLMKQILKSERFGELEISDYVNEIDEDTQTQFSAITVKLSRKDFVVVFRGTGDTLIGWKEDFNMSFVCPVPAQKKAVEYLENVTPRKGSLILCGHSKGGNLATFAAAFSKKNVKKRILSVYNFDGPGFHEDIVNSDSYKEISSKVHTFVPQSSIVGFLLGREEPHSVIHSAQIGFFQHDLYSWEILRNGFLYLDETSRSSQFVDSTLKEWLKGMDYKKREQFVEAMYSFISDIDAKTVKDMGENWFSNVRAIVKAAKNMDEETKEVVSLALKSLFEAAKQTVKRRKRQK